MSDVFSLVLSFFVHPEERRLRAPFRLAVLGVVIVIFAVPAILVALLARLNSIGASLTLNFVVLVPSILLTAWLVDRRRPLLELGIPTTPRAALGSLWGALLGAALIGGIALLESLCGWAEYTWLGPSPGSLALSIVLFGMVAIHEELLFRGYLLTNLAEGIGGAPATRVRGLVGATLITSFGFALAHLLNPNPSLLAMTNIGLAGVFLAVPFVIRGELGASMGLHFGWNLMQCWLGMAVSGNEVEGAWVTRTIAPGHDLFTGGPFGAEGGVLGLGAVVLGTLAAIPLSLALREPRRAQAIGLPPERAVPKAGSAAPPEARPLGG